MKCPKCNGDGWVVVLVNRSGDVNGEPEPEQQICLECLGTGKEGVGELPYF